MDSIGAEVGQKMRSAIKAKLLELNCYVDDELPDYIMVMVANKRTKSQMNEDLHLFLSNKTSVFVDWLHIVLKKLKEVTVTNPEVYKKVTKRRSSDPTEVKIKKEKKSAITKKGKSTEGSEENTKSLTDNLPISANRLSEQRKIIICNEKVNENVCDDNFDIPLLSEVNMSSEKDLEDIEKKIRSVKSRLGILVDSDLEDEIHNIKLEKAVSKETEESQKSNNSVNRVVQLQNASNSEATKSSENNTNAEDAVNIETEVSAKRKQHKQITLEEVPKKPSVLERLGKRSSIDQIMQSSKRTRISLSEFRKEEEPFLKYSAEGEQEERRRQSERDWNNRRDYWADGNTRERQLKQIKRNVSRNRRNESSSLTRTEQKKESILSRLGVMSKIYIPQKETEEPESDDELKTREVRSVVQVKPRVIPSDAPQPNKNLLLKAVAEAHRSVAQTPNVGNNSLKSDILHKEARIRNRENSEEEVQSSRKLSQNEKMKLRNLILTQAIRDKKNVIADNKEEEYVPKPIKSCLKETPEYVPSCRNLNEGKKTAGDLERQFIVTLDGIDESIFVGKESSSPKSILEPQKSIQKPSVKTRLQGKKSPSPIIFDNSPQHTLNSKNKPNVPDKLPIVHPPLSLKNKERCKYWPNCRQGDKCEFTHPNTNCEMFPHCKFGEKCLYLHPYCKFGSSCTKRECPYSHTTGQKTAASRGIPPVPTVQTCKFFPNCTNINCSFYHPKLCKFGKYCKNQAECNFSHTFVSKTSLTWRSK